MEVIERHWFALDHPSHPGEVRRSASALATRLGCDETDAGRMAVIATEAATNVVKHAGAGEILLYGGREDGAWRLGIVAIDRGPGMADLATSMRDGVSTAGSPGTGLGAIRRLSTAFDLHSSPAGTALFAELGTSRNGRGTFDVGIVRAPHPGEVACGDDCAVVCRPDGRCTVLVVDGLGHGLEAAGAAEEATRLFRSRPGAAPEAVMAMLHDGLRGTRGAAAAVAEIDTSRRLVRYAGIGNVAGTVQADGTTRSMVSHHGTLGHRMHRIQEFTYPWPERGLVVLHSDGLSARWDLGAYPGLARHHPMLVAGVLYRDFGRRTDDACVVVVREAA